MDYSKLMERASLSGYDALSGGVNAWGLGGMGVVRRGGFGAGGSSGGGNRYRRTPFGWHSHSGLLSTFTSPGSDGQTHQTIHTVEAPIVAARVILLNNETTSPTIDAVAVAPSTTLPANRNPTVGTFTRVTFGGQNSPTLPVRLGVNRPSRTPSDWMSVSSLTPTDGTTLPYMFWRLYYATGPASGYLGSGNQNATGSGSLAASGITIWPNAADARTAGRIVVINSKTGDFVSTNQSGFATPNSSFAPAAMEFEYQYAANVITVCALGDSITQGDTASIPTLSPVHYACAAISTAAKPVVSCNQGWSNQTTTNFAARLQDIIDSGRRPHILVYSAGSPNDITAGSITSTQTDLMKANLSTIMGICRSYGIYLILTTWTPVNYTGINDLNRIAFDDYVRALAGPGVGIADYEAALTDGATPAKMQTIYTDGVSGVIHPYDAGYILMGETTLSNALAAAVSHFT